MQRIAQDNIYILTNKDRLILMGLISMLLKGEDVSITNGIERESFEELLNGLRGQSV
jgi:hypothetical protein